VLLSLPYYGPALRLDLSVPGGGRIKVAKKIGLPKRYQFNGEHHWEIGTRGNSIRSVTAEIASIMTIERNFTCVDNPYHHFFVCRPNRAA
jgi:hypothetical protein